MVRLRGEGHTWGGGGPHQANLFGGQAVGGVHQIGQAAFQGLGFGGGDAGGFDGLAVLFLQPLDIGGRKFAAARQGLADGSGEGIGIEFMWLNGACLRK